MRLAGLYTATRGPHSFWLEKTRGAGAASGAQNTQRGSSASVVNMLHHEDAAAAAIAAMKATGTHPFKHHQSCIRWHRQHHRLITLSSHSSLTCPVFTSWPNPQTSAAECSWPATTSQSPERRSAGLHWLRDFSRDAVCQWYVSFFQYAATLHSIRYVSSNSSVLPSHPRARCATAQSPASYSVGSLDTPRFESLCVAWAARACRTYHTGTPQSK